MAEARHAASRAVAVPLVTAALALLLTTGLAVPGDGSPPGTVRGCVGDAGQLRNRGVAALWPAGAGKAPDPRRAIRPPVVSRPLEPDGCFTLEAPPGDYFVGAVIRAVDGGWQGPPRPGDRVFLSPDAAGGNTSVTLQAGKRIDIGRHDSGWTYAGFTDRDAAPTISGRLTGPDGLPREGLLVFAFTDREMTSEPLAVSEPSDAAGRYLLRLPEPATVYLRAREHYGRRTPSAGGSMGIYGEDSPTAVTVPAGGDRQERNLSILLIPPSNERPTGIAGAGAASRIEKTSSKNVDTKN